MACSRNAQHPSRTMETSHLLITRLSSIRLVLGSVIESPCSSFVWKMTVLLKAVGASAGIPFRTARRWVSLYRQFGLAALARRKRTETGEHREISSKLKEAIEGIVPKAISKQRSGYPNAWLDIAPVGLTTGF